MEIGSIYSVCSYKEFLSLVDVFEKMWFLGGR